MKIAKLFKTAKQTQSNKFQFTFNLHDILFLGSLVYPSSPAVEEMGEKKGNFSHFQPFINALKIQVE